MKINILNIKSITQKNVKRLQYLANSLSSKKNPLKITYREYPKEHLVYTVSFDLDCEVNDVLDVLITFLVFIQNIDYQRPKGKWFSIKIGNFVLSFFGENQKNFEVDFK